MKTRNNALNMGTWDDPLLWYAKAVREMQKRAANDPTSWLYQAAIHGYTGDKQDPASADWQKRMAGHLPLASQNDQITFWQQCQHSTWYFLPWHRMYLGYFEKIVGSVIVGLGGPTDWALPYWNYNQGPASGKLPDAFTQATLPDGTPNPLLETERDHGNNGQPFLPARDVSLKSAFAEHQFEGNSSGGSNGFGGPVTFFNHGGGPFGALENLPHNAIHVDIGGLMGDPDTAALDPIFWLHHGNIDRLWDVWLRADAANSNPVASSPWQTFAFKFNDGSGNVVTLSPKDVLDTKASPFYYQYDNLSAAGVAVTIAAPVDGLGIAALMAKEPPIPEMAGASSQPTALGSQASTMSVRLFPMTGPLKALGAAEAPFQKAYLHVENVRGEGHPENYDVYLNVPEGAEQPPEELHAGVISSFGLARASRGTEQHPGSGLRLTFNVTDTVNHLKAQNLWNPALLRVTFVPRDKLGEGDHIEVGRVSLYFT